MPAHNTTKIEKSPYFQTAKFYYNLPSIMRNLKNDTLFKITESDIYLNL
jgi:hypothetical protein